MGESSESSARPTTLAEARERLAEARAAVRRNEGLGSGRSGEGAGDDLASKVETVRRAVAAMNSGEALADVRERKVGSARTHPGTADADQGSPSKAVGVAVEQLQSIKPTVVSAAQKRLSTLSTPFSPRRVLSAEPRAAQAWQPPASPKSSPASQRRASGVNQNSRTPSFTPSSREREQRREREADTQRGGAVRPKTAAAVSLHSGSGGSSRSGSGDDDGRGGDGFDNEERKGEEVVKLQQRWVEEAGNEGRKGGDESISHLLLFIIVSRLERCPQQ